MIFFQNAARQAATASTHLINSSNMANRSNTNTTSQHELEMQCKVVNDQLATLVQGFRAVANNPDSASAQLQLLKACQEFIQVCVEKSTQGSVMHQSFITTQPPPPPSPGGGRGIAVEVSKICHISAGEIPRVCFI